MPLSIKFVIEQIWAVLRGHISDFQSFGGVIVGFLFAVEMVDEALDLVAGRGFKLDKKLIIYLFVALFIINYNTLGSKVWESAVNTGDLIITRFGEIKTTTEQAQKDAADLASLSTPGILRFVKAILALPKLILFGFATLLISLSLLILLIMIGGAYACLGFIIISGPLFIAFLVSPHTRSLFMNWLQNLLSYFIMIPFLGWTMDISYNIFLQCFNQWRGTGLGGTPEVSSMMILIIGPVIAIGITLQVPKIVSTLTGGAVSAGMSGISAAGGAIMTGNKMTSSSGGSSVAPSGSGGSSSGAGLIGGVIGKK